jgi:hypothetical protein
MCLERLSQKFCLKLFFIFFYRFDMLMLKMIFKKQKNNIFMYFLTKNILKNNRCHTLKYKKDVHRGKINR